MYVCTEIEKWPHSISCDMATSNRTVDSIYTKQEILQLTKRKESGIVAFWKRATIQQSQWKEKMVGG